ncbi:7963_t:CDS:2 [Ambispora gerdemannii]|uniref:7963_t:CDS:1 n=1 Tax=Ambispora gerdemannii TaxID=144530 RepID=A0A9N8V429_9GLOM|nr:7963_t:CDS:2 [Ambispora gerdemannii]
MPSSLLTNTASYLGMASVGLLLLPMQWTNIIRRKPSSPGTEIDMVAMGAGQNTKDYSLLPDDDEDLENDHDVIDRSVNETQHDVNYKSIIRISSLDVCANFLLTIGFFYIGSGMFQVIYSSVVVWCAILSFFFLQRKISLVQWFCIIGVSFGLGISAVGIESSDQGEHKAPPPTTTTSGPVLLHSFNLSSTGFGTMLTFVATFLYSCVYVLSDKILSTKNHPNINPPSPEKTCFLVGSCCSSFSLVYLLVYTIPNWDKLVMQEMITKKSDITTPVIIIIYILLIFAAFIHNFAYFSLMQSTGNISTGLLNSLRAIVVFGLSHLLFCKIDPGQCFNIWKGWSALVVIGCVTVFSVSKAREK